ncbi:uncharacterized protein LOC129611146 [Condylostylus longicornis]|uniref:uncharacterized protein LOC129611146 n=1 Tax=Condylostylus longicornis TaxID=2530218 RepID=UPI00244DDFFA|nr:uncharacterized protein LOC129611146 [Condylostylus longicornis]XP_055380089.1 uncharacterized protein LOC129611146 [Condylostylus longicornis]
MGKDFIGAFSNMDIYPSKHPALNKITELKIRTCTQYNRHDEKSKQENSVLKAAKNGLEKNCHNNFQSFEETSCNRKIQNGLKKLLNGVSKFKNVQYNNDVVIISSDDSLSMDEFKRKVNEKDNDTYIIEYLKNSRTHNGKNHTSCKTFKRRNVIVRIKRSHKIQNLLNKNKLRCVSSNTLSNKLTKQLKSQSKNKEADSYIDSNKKTWRNSLNDNLNIFSSKKCNYSTRNRSLTHTTPCDTEPTTLDKSLQKFPLFETIFIDTINIEDSENSSSLHTSPNKEAIDLKFEKKHQIHHKEENSLHRRLIKSNIATKKKARTRLKNFKKLESGINLKNCIVKVKNLSLAQIKKKIKEARYRANRRRRSWSVSDVAREHDRRLNFFPKAGPSHIDYHALIKLPTVKPKVPRTLKRKRE